MPRIRRPKRGSRAFWPRKRAERIYPVITVPQENDFNEAKPLGFAGYKAGMTRAMIVDKNNNSPTFGQTIEIPITVLDCPPVFVYGYRFYGTTTNRVLTQIVSDKLPKYASRKVTVAKNKKEAQEPTEFTKIKLLVMTQPEKSGLGKKTPELFEIPLGGESAAQLEYAKSVLGKELTAKDIFKDGEQIDVSSVTKGRGFEGPVKRYGIAIQDRHVKMKHRHVGTLGPENQGRVKPGVIPYAGQHGFQTRTEFNKRIIKIGEDGTEVTPSAGFTHYGVVKGNYVILEGTVPGPQKRLITLRRGLRALKPIAHELKSLSM